MADIPLNEVTQDFPNKPKPTLPAKAGKAMNMVPMPSGGGGSVVVSSEVAMKTQFVSGEDLKITLPPFIDKTTGERIIGTDVATIVVKSPSGLFPSPPTPSWDADVYFWLAEIPAASFIEGEWLVLATSDDANALPQFKVLTWGDYMDDIPETRQAALGRWRIIGTQLNLYEDDGVTVFKTYDLKDADGNPSNTRVFERDPV